MRAVKTVITAAGKFRQSNPSDTEETIVLLALRSVNLPKFLAHDVPLFEGILSDLFPGASMPATVYEGLMPALHTAAEKAGLVPESPFLNRCVQLWDTTQVRHGVMVVGPAGTGKSAVIDTLAGAVSTLAETHTKAFSPYMPVRCRFIIFLECFIGCMCLCTVGPASRREPQSRYPRPTLRRVR